MSDTFQLIEILVGKAQAVFQTHEWYEDNTPEMETAEKELHEAKAALRAELAQAREELAQTYAELMTAQEIGAQYQAELAAAQQDAHRWATLANDKANELAALKEAAHMPDDYQFGLPSWINQRLYAAYIGAEFSPEVLAHIAIGRLTFPDAPVYKELAALRERQRWVKVSERLPEVMGLYITHDNNDEITTNWFDPNKPGYWINYIKYWMPLPEPPEA